MADAKTKAQKLRERRALNPEKHRAEVKTWKTQNRDKLLAQKARAYKENREEILRKRREHRLKLKQLIDATFGTECLLCGAKPSRFLHLHEIHGKKHSNGRQYILSHKEDFVRLCARCHTMVGQLMKVFNLSWESILHLKPGN